MHAGSTPSWSLLKSRLVKEANLTETDVIIENEHETDVTIENEHGQPMSGIGGTQQVQALLCLVYIISQKISKLRFSNRIPH